MKYSRCRGTQSICSMRSSASYRRLPIQRFFCALQRSRYLKTKRENLLLSEKPDLIAEMESYEDKLRRTRIVASIENKSCDELGQIIYQQARKNGNCLAIVNLKKEAREIFQCLERLDVNHEFELIRLSTAMCGRHRTDCLNRIGALLDPGNPKPVICVSTQLIEAGVDISFACVVRAVLCRPLGAVIGMVNR